MEHQTLKKIFSDDPETLRILELKEQTELLRELASHKPSFEGIEMIKGEKGDKGDTGEKGEQGEAGKDGKDGRDGIDGKDGRDGADGIDGKDGINGIDGKSPTNKELIKLIETLLEDLKAEDFGAVDEEKVEKIAKKHAKGVHDKLDSRISNLRSMVELNYGGHGGTGGGVSVMAYDLSPYLDGITSSFTIPANSSIAQITSSSAPFVFRPTVDYMGSGTTTLTFDAGIDPASMLASGQSIIILYLPS